MGARVAVKGRGNARQGTWAAVVVPANGDAEYRQPDAERQQEAQHDIDDRGVWATEGGFGDKRVVGGGLGAWVGGVNT